MKGRGVIRGNAHDIKTKEVGRATSSRPAYFLLTTIYS